MPARTPKQNDTTIAVSILLLLVSLQDQTGYITVVRICPMVCNRRTDSARLHLRLSNYDRCLLVDSYSYPHRSILV